MSHLARAEQLSRRGRFSEALQLLERLPIPPDERLAADAVRAELLERTGRYSASKTLAEQVLRNPRCLPNQRCSCLMALAYCAFEHGFIEASMSQFQKALSVAEVARDLRATCVCQLRVMNLLADRSGYLAITPMLAQVRRNVTKLGDGVTAAALHISIGELEAKRGFVGNAKRHVALAKNLLENAENIHWQGVAENILTAIGIMQSDHVDGIEHGKSAVQFATESGSHSLRRAALGNLGNLYLLTGQFEIAREYLEAASTIGPTTGALSNGALESLALLALAEGRTDDAEVLLSEMESGVRAQGDWMIYANRHSRLTFVEVMVRKKRLTDALAEVAHVIELADRSGDRQLQMNASLAKAELLIVSKRSDEALAILHDTVPGLPEHTPDTYARHQRAMALAFYGANRIALARRSLTRSQQTYQGLHNVFGECELTRVWQERCPSSLENDESHCKAADDLLQDVASLLLHAGRPRLVAAALVRLLEQTDGIVRAIVVSRGIDRSSETIAGFGSQSTETRVIDRVLAIGLERDRSIEVRLSLRADVESIANLNAVTLLLSTAHDLERARAEREERLTLWPLEDPIPIAEQAVVMGALSGLMAEARRVAGTSVNVLITGESGTGKEILARAIHRYSTRADRPFVPFNCAAVPREMLESQLFGHRRGAFTGADRDNPGVIRAANHGTLLLDEIGELSLELQPKLLRFLESGEISPLGDPNPMTVDVRIVAATNANLDQLVQEGRFREDLFYRLKVIPLTLPPLRERRDEIPALVHHFVARAAQEFRKARIRVAEETMEHLIVYAWPGNVRQLNNEVRRMVALAESDSTLKPAALSKEILRATPRAARGEGSPEFAVPLADKLQAALSRVEREMIKAALKTSDGRVDAAARALGISRKGLYLKRQRLGL